MYYSSISDYLCRNVQQIKVLSDNIIHTLFYVIEWRLTICGGRIIVRYD